MTPAMFAAYEKRMAVAQRRAKNEAILRTMRRQGASIRKIAKALNCCQKTVKRWVKRMGIQRR